MIKINCPSCNKIINPNTIHIPNLKQVNKGKWIRNESDPCIELKTVG